MKTRVLIDAKHLLYRAFYTSDTRGDPQSTEPTRNFLRLLEQTHRYFCGAEDDGDSDLVLCWDPEDSGDARKKIFTGYKAERLEKATPERLAEKERIKVQQRLAQRVLSVFGVVQVESPQWEGDDTIATLALRPEPDTFTTIVTGDRDLLCCCCDDPWAVQVARPVPGESLVFKVYDPQRVSAEFGVEPERLVELKALMGDSSDSIPGAKGIGPKKATDILSKFKYVTEAIRAAEMMDDRLAPVIRKALLDGKSDILLSHRLASVNCDAPLVYRESKHAGRAAARAAYNLCGFDEPDLLERLCKIGRI